MEFEVIRSNRKSLALEVRADKLLVRAPLQVTNEQINAFVLKNKKWIETHIAKSQAHQQSLTDVKKLTWDELDQVAEKALQVIPERVKHYAPLVGVTYGRITIRNQRTKWGSCSAKGNLNFNCMLVPAPPGVLDNVVVHELCHRKEMNHSDKFYAEVLRVFPDYWKQHQWLKDSGEMLMRMLPE